MKKIIKCQCSRFSVIISATIIGAMIVLTGCVDRESKQKVYSLGREYTFGSLIFKADIDEENERFTFDYKIANDSKDDVYFYFAFWNDSTGRKVENYLFDFKNSDGVKIVFDEYKTFSINTSCTIYAYYENAGDSIKECIRTYDFNIETTGGTYIPKQSYNQMTGEK